MAGVSLCAAEDTDFAAEINKLGTWIKWITDRKGTQDHNNHFFKTALPRITRVLLGRAYKHPDTEVPLVRAVLIGWRLARVRLTCVCDAGCHLPEGDDESGHHAHGGGRA